MLQELEELIGQALGSTIGDPLVLALVCLFFFVILIVVVGMDLTVGLMVLIPLIVMLTAYQSFPQWILLLVAFGCGGIIYLAVRQWMVSR